MDNDQKKHITQNIHRLINCTKNETDWCIHLIQHGLLTHNEWQSINQKENDTDSKIAAIYFTSIKTPHYDLLIKSLKDSDNDSAVQILEEFYSLPVTSEWTSQYELRDFIWFDNPTPTKYYKGRNNDLRTIEKCFEESLNDKSLMLVAITGLGGVGKSELAKIFVRKAYQEMNCHCIWINAKSTQTISDSIHRLAAKAGISLMDHQKNEKNLEVLSYDIYRKICKERCVFVFDDIESNDEIMPVFKSLVEYTRSLSPTKLKPFGLLSSRYKLISLSFGHSIRDIQLDILSHEDSVAFFIAALNIDKAIEDDVILPNIKEICERLKFFPLAMQQAVAYIKAVKRNDVTNGIRMYLSEFEKETKKLLNYPLPQLEYLDGVSKTTYPIWQITLKQIESNPTVGSRAENLLNIISLFNSDNIDVEFVAKIAEKLKIVTEETDVLTIFEVLHNYSMCQLKNRRKDNKNVVSVHRLVQKVTRIQLHEKNEYIPLVDNLLKIIFEMFLTNNNNDEFALSDMINVEILWKHAAKSKELVKKHKRFPEKIFYKYYVSGRYRDANDYIFGAIEHLIEAVGTEDRATLKTMYWKGVVHDELGEYQKSLELLENVYEKQKRIFGENDNHTLITARQIGVVHWGLKNLRQAMKWANDTLEKRETNPKENIDETLELKNLQALVLDEEGKYEEALKIHEEILALRLKLMGDYYQPTLNTKNNIGTIKYKQGKYDEALMIHQQVLEVREKVFGNDHPDTLITKSCIGNIRVRQGKYEDALSIYEEVLPARQRLLGDNHPQTVKTKSNIQEIKRRSNNCAIQ